MLLNHERLYWEKNEAISTVTEINQQPITWLKTVDIIDNNKLKLEVFLDFLNDTDNLDIIFTGAGSSEFVGNSLVLLLNKNNVDRFKSVATTNLVSTPELYIKKDQPTILVSFGRSGNSPESLAAITLATQINPNTKHLIITCNEEGEIANLDNKNSFVINLPPETNDASFAMTSSFTNMFLAGYLIFNLNKLEENKQNVIQLSEVLKKVLNDMVEMVNVIVDNFDFDRIIYLGDAELISISNESALKILELTAGDIVSTYNTTLGFRHGPKSIVNEDSLVVIYLHRNPYMRSYQKDIIVELASQRKGYKILVIDIIEDKKISELSDYYFTFKFDEVLDDLKGMAYVISAQLISLYKALSIGKTPDNPWPSGVVNRVVQGVNIYPYKKGV